MKKYELTTETMEFCGRTLTRIRALINIDRFNVKAGDLGGWIESEKNLSNELDAWVYGDAKVYGDASVYGNALVSGNAMVFGNARVYGDARVYCDASVHGDASVYGDALVYDDALVYGDARVYGNAIVYGDAMVYGDAKVSGNAIVYGDAMVSCDADYATIKGFGSEYRTTTFFRCKDNTIKVVCGCFFGTIDEFRKQVIKTRYGKIAEEYLTIADLMERHFQN